MLDLMPNYVQLLTLAPVTAVTADVLVGLHHWHNPVMLKKKKQIKNTIKTRLKEPSSGLRTSWQKFTTLII